MEKFPNEGSAVAFFEKQVWAILQCALIAVQKIQLKEQIVTVTGVVRAEKILQFVLALFLKTNA